MSLRMGWRVVLAAIGIASGIQLAPLAWAQVRNVDDRIFEINGVTGKGKSVDEAIFDAKRVAVDQAVRVLFAQTDQELNRYTAARSQIMANLDQLVENAQMTDKYRDGSDVFVQITGNVLRAPLKGRLLALGIISELDQDFSGAAIPRLAVLVSPESKERELAAFAAGRINDHLTAQHLATVDDGTLGTLAQEDRALLGATAGGPNATIAQADVVLVLSVLVTNTANVGAHSLYQADVSIESLVPGMATPISVETYRSRELTFKTGEDREKARRAAVEEAIGGAIRPVMQTVLRSVKEEKTLGKVYNLRLSGDPTRFSEVKDALRARTRTATFTNSPPGAIVTVRFEGQLDELLAEIASDPALRLRVTSESARYAEVTIEP